MSCSRGISAHTIPRPTIDRRPRLTLELRRDLAPGLVVGEDSKWELETKAVLPAHLSAFRDVTFLPPPLYSARGPIAPANFSGARIVGRHPLPLTSSGDLIQEALFRSADRNHLAVSYLRPHEILGLRWFPRKAALAIDGQACLLGSFWDSFGHWIPEHFLKIWSLLESGQSIESMRFIVRAPVDDFKLVLLEKVGVGRNQIIEWHGSFAIVEELVVPTYPQICEENLGWVRGLFDDLERGPQSPKSMLYLSRQRQGYRRIDNEEAVQEVLSDYNFETVFAEELGLEEQVRLATNAQFMFGPQGSAFTLQIFMRNGGVLEAFPRDRVHLFNRQVAQVLGHQYRAMMDSRGPEKRGFSDKSVAVNVDELRSALESWLSIN